MNMNFPNDTGRINPMMNVGMGMKQGNLMMNPFLLQQQQAMMNNMLQNQQLINNKLNTPNPPNSNYINIFFKQEINYPDLDPYTIQCSLYDKISIVIKKFRIKAKDYDILNEKFVFNGKKLNETLLVFESGLTNNAVVFVIKDKQLLGTF